MTDLQKTEFVSVRLPFGAAEAMADVASKMGLTRSELLRRAVAAYIQDRAASPKTASAG